ncbi:MAG: hypothetical protein LBE38_00450 [Deltaproteobacteria bacterium]|jgi:OOP family OmpA-OmpF porin|nr:hypothetical protein [Deltaproteobacteria bacterium]
MGLLSFFSRKKKAARALSPLEADAPELEEMHLKTDNSDPAKPLQEESHKGSQAPLNEDTERSPLPLADADPTNPDPLADPESLNNLINPDPPDPSDEAASLDPLVPSEEAASLEPSDPSDEAASLDPLDPMNTLDPPASASSEEPPGTSQTEPQTKTKNFEDSFLEELDSFFTEEEGETTISEEKEETGKTFDFEPKGSVNYDPESQGEENLAAPELKLPPAADPDSEMGRLKSLIMEREMRQITNIQEKVDDPKALANTISQVITEAILMRRERDDKLNTVLAPTVEKIVTASVRRNPETLANQIFPVIGPAIRRAISDTFVSMLQSFNSMLETSFSLKGLKWRLEAWKVHKPFSEIVLLHTLLYHVEEIYLIHAESGLVLDHLVYEGGEARDSELVAAMFTAIRDFIRDSFSVDKKEHLDNLRFGERTIFLQRTEKIFMACVVRGNPPVSLNQELQNALELMAVNSSEDLDNFTGDATAFKKNRPFFQPFLEARYEDKKEKLPFFIRMIPLAIIIILAILIGVGIYDSRVEARNKAHLAQMAQIRQNAATEARAAIEARVLKAVDKLNLEPGIAVARVAPIADGNFEIVCLKDEYAVDPQEFLINEAELNPASFTLLIKPFMSMDEAMVLKRVEAIIKPPPGATATFDSNTGELTLTGQAPQGWIYDVRSRALAISGIKTVNTEGITDPQYEKFTKLINEVNSVVIHFPLGKAVPEPYDAQLLEDTVDKLMELQEMASTMGLTLSLTVFGHADSTGSELRNYELSQERTRTIAAKLYAKGSTMPIINYGMGSESASTNLEATPGRIPGEDPDSRKIQLWVNISSRSSLETPTMQAPPGATSSPPPGAISSQNN